MALLRGLKLSHRSWAIFLSSKVRRLSCTQAQPYTLGKRQTLTRSEIRSPDILTHYTLVRRAYCISDQKYLVSSISQSVSPYTQTSLVTRHLLHLPHRHTVRTDLCPMCSPLPGASGARKAVQHHLQAFPLTTPGMASVAPACAAAHLEQKPDLTPVAPLRSC